MRTSDQIIKAAVEAGKSPAEIQAELREGFSDSDITVNMAIQALALGQEQLLSLIVKLFAEAVKLQGAEVDVERMFQAYLDSFNLAHDAFFYDMLNPQAEVEGEVVEDGEDGDS